jgi:hypothetical protein
MRPKNRLAQVRVATRHLASSEASLTPSSRRTDLQRRHDVAYALAVTVFGGTAQLVVTWLIRVTGDPLSPAWYHIASGIVGIAAMMMMKETRGVELED